MCVDARALCAPLPPHSPARAQQERALSLSQSGWRSGMGAHRRCVSRAHSRSGWESARSERSQIGANCTRSEGNLHVHFTGTGKI